MNESLLTYVHSLRLDPYPTPDYQICRTISQLADYIPDDFTHIAEDTENIPDGTPYCLTVSHTPGTARLIHAKDTHILEWYRVNICTAQVTRIFHNFLHDVRVVEELGIPVTGPFFDTMLMAYELCLGGGGDEEEGMAGRGSLGLKQLSFRHLNMTMTSFKDTVHPHSLPKLHTYLREVLDLYPTPPRKSKKHTPTPEDKLISLFRRKINSLLGNSGSVEGEEKENKEQDHWKRVEGWHSWDREFLLVNGEVPRPSVADVPEPELIQYACRDADATLRLYGLLEGMMTTKPPWLFF